VPLFAGKIQLFIGEGSALAHRGVARRDGAGAGAGVVAAAGDQGQVLADLSCAIAHGAEVISDFRVLADLGGLFGPAASVPACWRAGADRFGGGRRPVAAVAVRRSRPPADPAVPDKLQKARRG
jgi:hypothetical protein